MRSRALVDPHRLRAHLQLDKHPRTRADHPLLLDEHAQHAPGRRNHAVVHERARLSLGDRAPQPGVRVLREVVAALHLGDEHTVRSQGGALLHHGAAPIGARVALADRQHALSGQPRSEDVAGGLSARPNVGVARRVRECIAPRGDVTVCTVASVRTSVPHGLFLRFARFFRRSHWLRGVSRRRPVLGSLDFARFQRRPHSHSLDPVRWRFQWHRSAAHCRLALVFLRRPQRKSLDSVRRRLQWHHSVAHRRLALGYLRFARIQRRQWHRTLSHLLRKVGLPTYGFRRGFRASLPRERHVGQLGPVCSLCSQARLFLHGFRSGVLPRLGRYVFAAESQPVDVRKRRLRLLHWALLGLVRGRCAAVDQD